MKAEAKKNKGSSSLSLSALPSSFTASVWSKPSPVGTGKTGLCWQRMEREFSSKTDAGFVDFYSPLLGSSGSSL